MKMLLLNTKITNKPLKRKCFLRFIFTIGALIVLFNNLYSQSNSPISTGNLIYIDEQGILRSSANKEPVSFFGVNYTVPFAFAYRAIKTLGISHEKAIEDDVYHMARLGVDAFRVHVWDIEITDSLGNLLENEHLRLYDFLISKLKERNIKILLTPIAYWGNGYPEKDTPTSGFSNYYSKDQAYKDPKAIEAQANYLKQFLKHVNPYTKLSYVNDPDIIALEVCNEPKHSGDPLITTAFINKMVDACRSVKWEKPIFYNVSENQPEFADAILNANIDGCTFQWYPAGLVRWHELKGNFLPYVDKYNIPFKNKPGFLTRAKAVYEFETADILKSYMYPAVARSFKEAGFQWATQFAYEPLAIAYCNAEYPTHYVNLAYTPSKAISLLIASKVFHNVPVNRNFGTYPNDSVFDVFRVSYSESLSEMNSETEFYYTNSTKTNPVNSPKLRHIAGCGSSPVVEYKGCGAYFIDKLGVGIWRLEVMPDAITLINPFDKPSFEKEVTRIQWQNNNMIIKLPDLGEEFSIKGLNEGNNYNLTSRVSEFTIGPGTYLLIRKGAENNNWKKESKYENILIGEYVAPKPIFTDPVVMHNPYYEISEGKAIKIGIEAVGIDTSDHVTLNVFGPHKPILFKQKSAYGYEAEIPAEIVKPGILSYVIMVRKDNQFITFPGKHTGSLYDWNFYHKDSWSTVVVPSGSPLTIFNAIEDRDNIEYSFNAYWQKQFSTNIIPSEIPKISALRITATNLLDKEHALCFRSYFGDKLTGRMEDIALFNEVSVRAKAVNCDSTFIKIILISKSGHAFGSLIQLKNEFNTYHIPLSSFVPDSMVLIPRPYPGFLPFWFKADGTEKINLSNSEVLEIAIGPGKDVDEYSKPTGFEVEYVFFNTSEKN